MGTWSRNFLVHNTPATAVRDRFVLWMERRGFDLMSVPPLFDCDKETERCAFLFSNSQWTALLYSEAFMEGDRMLSEFSEFSRVVEVWIGDSDDWGYALYEKGEFTCGCTLNQEHETAASKPPASAEDAAKLCRALGIPERFNTVLKAQRKRHLFADVPCEKFCQAMEVEPAIFTARDMEQWNEGSLEAREIAGWHVTPLYFEKHRRLGEEPAGPMLHSIAVRAFNPDPRVFRNPEMEELVRANVQMLKWVFLPIRWVMTPIAWTYVTVARVAVWFGKLGIKLSPKAMAEGNLSSILASRGKPWKREGEWLVNRRHRCRIRVPIAESERKPTPFLFGVFTFTVGLNEVPCTPLRPVTVRKIFDLRPQQTAVSDDSFQIGPHAARKLTVRMTEGDGVSYCYRWFVELPAAIYQFSLYLRSELAAADEAAIETIVRSFETFDEVSNLRTTP